MLFFLLVFAVGIEWVATEEAKYDLEKGNDQRS